MHPLESSREYVRALNATKLDKVFAKPFIASLSGHSDGIYTMCKHPTKLSVLLTGACDGELKVWSLSSKQCLTSVTAHTGFIRGLCMNSEGNRFISVGDDSVIKLWEYPDSSIFNPDHTHSPISTILGKTSFSSIDHHQSDSIFATCGDQVDVWNETRSEPLLSFTWGPDNISHIKFNPVQTNIMATCGSDRAIALYDIRQSSPLQKVILSHRSNAIAWNPMEAFHFTAANEDSNLYTFDMRRLQRPLNIHLDHVNAVMDVDYCPTGTQFVTGSFDKTVRIFETSSRHSHEIYHTKRMQRVFSVCWSNDATYILSGSDDMNIRIWKAKASQKLGRLTNREQKALDYANKLKDKYRYHPQIQRIARHRHVPKLVRKTARERRIMLEAKKRRHKNLARHSTPGTIPKKTVMDEKVVGIVE